MLAEIGLILVVLAWAMQVHAMRKSGRTGFDMRFVFVYAIGCFFLVMDAMISQKTFVGVLYMLATILALISGMFTLKR